MNILRRSRYRPPGNLVRALFLLSVTENEHCSSRAYISGGLMHSTRVAHLFFFPTITFSSLSTSSPLFSFLSRFTTGTDATVTTL